MTPTHAWLEANAARYHPGVDMLGLAQILWFQRIAVAAQLVAAGRVAVRLATHLRRCHQRGAPLSRMRAPRHRLAASMARIGALGVDRVIEVRPSTALSGLVRRTLPGVASRFVGRPDDIDWALGERAPWAAPGCNGYRCLGPYRCGDRRSAGR